MNMTVFKDFDFSDFWDNNSYAQKEYIGAALTDEMLLIVETKLGYELPKSYVELLRIQNGGMPLKTRHKTNLATSWSQDHVAITGIFGIDKNKSCSLIGGSGQALWVEDWDYPKIGVYFADCPSAGHDMLCLDYCTCGPSGEPSVVHVDQEDDYKITFVAANFETFIRGLEPENNFLE